MAFLVNTIKLAVFTLIIFGSNPAKGQADILIGQPCNETEQCVGQPNSRCTAICNCISTHTPSSRLDDCLLIQNQLGGPCQESHQCQRGTPGLESICQDGQCRCGPAFINPADENKCYRKAVEIGDACEKDVQCLVNLGQALCLGGKCTCTSDAVAGGNGTKCLEKLQLWGFCVEQGQCEHISNALCTPALGRDHSECRCSTNENGTFVPNPNNRFGHCMKMARELGEPCGDHEYQCNPLRRSHCNVTTDTCECRTDDQVASQGNTYCLDKLLSLNASCSQSQQCQVENSDCLSGSCGCTVGFVEGITTPNKCLVVGAELGDACQENIQCHQLGGSHCNLTLHTCQCHSKDQVPSQDNTACLEKMQLWGTCVEQGQCAHIPNAICSPAPGRNHSECQCSSDENGIFVPNPNDRLEKCMKMGGELGESCEDHEYQCNRLRRSHCNVTTQSCTCRDTDQVASGSNTYCLDQVKSLNESCFESQQCSVANSGCLSGTCRCSDGFVEGVVINNRCLPVGAQLGDQCQESLQCDGLGGSHRNQTTHKCQCRDEDQVSSQDNKFCLDKVLTLHSSCYQSQQCQVENSDCLSGACACTDGFVEGITTPNKCLAVGAKLGDECQEDIQCRDIAFDQSVICRDDGHCNCPRTLPPTEFFNGQCVLPAKLGYPCGSHTDCHLGVNNLTACVLKEGSVPAEKWCVCLPNTIKLHDTCWGTKHVNDDCLTTLECAVTITGPVTCDNGTRKCTCGEEYVEHSSKTSCVHESDGNCGGDGANELQCSSLLLALISVVVFILSK